MFAFDGLKKDLKEMLNVTEVDFETSILTLDTLDIIELGCLIENLFNIYIPVRDISECETYGDLYHLIKEENIHAN